MSVLLKSRPHSFLVVKEVNICLLLVYWKIAGIPDKTYFYGVLTLGAKMTKVVAAWVQQFAPGWLSWYRQLFRLALVNNFTGKIKLIDNSKNRMFWRIVGGVLIQFLNFRNICYMPPIRHFSYLPIQYFEFRLERGVEYFSWGLGVGWDDSTRISSQVRSWIDSLESKYWENWLGTSPLLARWLKIGF